MILRRLPVGIALAAACVTFAAGCSSSSPSSAAATSAASATTDPAATPATTQPASTEPGPSTTSASTTGGSATTDDTPAITAAFTTFFDGVDPDVDGKIAVLEHGDQLRSMIVDAAANPQFQQLTTTVNSVSVLSEGECAAADEVAPCASVGHDMFVGGLPAMVGLQSHAVKVDGVWKVSAKSWCAVVEIGGAACPPLTE